MPTPTPCMRQHDGADNSQIPRSKWAADASKGSLRVLHKPLVPARRSGAAKIQRVGADMCLVWTSSGVGHGARYGEYGYGLRWTFDSILVLRILAQLSWLTSGGLPMYGTSTGKATPTFRTRALHSHRRAVSAGKKQPAAHKRPVRPRDCDLGELAAFWPRYATVHHCISACTPHSLTQYACAHPAVINCSKPRGVTHNHTVHTAYIPVHLLLHTIKTMPCWHLLAGLLGNRDIALGASVCSD